jgi:Raf kinase inhibitor-like YbhB/YbcL family protein
MTALLSSSAGGATMSLRLTSTAFQDQGEVPSRYTCESTTKPEPSPPLAWSGVPATAKSLALVVDDPDAPQETWTHWVLYNLPSKTTTLPEGTTQATLPRGTREGLNDWQKTGYGGPCPPSGRHRYVFKIYALDRQLPDLKQPTREQLESAMNGHIVAQGELIGTYAKHGN